jgi:DNA-directed RNA polymerase specialized sigma24 family protein
VVGVVPNKLHELMSTTDRPVSTVTYAEDLVRRVRANEPLAFDELYARYSPRVFGYLFQRLNGDAEEAEDLTADVFTRVYEKIAGLPHRPQSAD